MVVMCNMMTVIFTRENNTILDHLNITLRKILVKIKVIFLLYVFLKVKKLDYVVGSKCFKMMLQPAATKYTRVTNMAIQGLCKKGDTFF